MAYNILTGEKRNIISLLLELYSITPEVVLPKKNFFEHQSDQASNYQFIGNTRDRETC